MKPLVEPRATDCPRDGLTSYPAARQIIGNLLRGSKVVSIVPNAAMVAVALLAGIRATMFAFGRTEKLG